MRFLLFLGLLISLPTLLQAEELPLSLKERLEEELRLITPKAPMNADAEMISEFDEMVENEMIEDEISTSLAAPVRKDNPIRKEIRVKKRKAPQRNSTQDGFRSPRQRSR